MKVSYYLHIADTIATRKPLVANSACMQSDQPAVDTGNVSSYGCICKSKVIGHAPFSIIIISALAYNYYLIIICCQTGQYMSPVG